MADYVGAGTSLSSNYYMRRFYTSNSSARTATGRSDMRGSELSLADSTALRRAVQSLRKTSFSEENEANM